MFGMNLRSQRAAVCGVSGPGAVIGIRGFPTKNLTMVAAMFTDARAGSGVSAQGGSGARAPGSRL
jgi:hypothetical protein